MRLSLTPESVGQLQSALHSSSSGNSCVEIIFLVQPGEPRLFNRESSPKKVKGSIKTPKFDRAMHVVIVYYTKSKGRKNRLW